MTQREVSCYWTRREVLVAFLGAVILLAWHLKNSFEFGRLAFVPAYDDVSYFQDALTRYLKFQGGDILLLLRDAVANPPHAPFIAVQAVLSYMVFGVEDWAPYVTNVWIPFLALLGVMALTRGMGAERLALFLYVMTVPMLGAAVVEFRPDIAAGVLTAACVALCVYAVTDCGEGILTRQVIWSGALLGAALWAKPSAVIYNVGLVGLGLLLAILGLLLSRRQTLSLGFQRSVVICLIGFALAAPYYAVAGHKVIEYTWNAVVRDKVIWAVQMDWQTHLAFYLLGPGGRFMLGLHLWVAAASILLLAIFHRSIDSLQRLRFLVLLGVAAGGYLVVAANAVKTHFLGVGFQSVWIIFSVLVFAELMRCCKGRLVRVLPVFVAAVSLLSIQPVVFWSTAQAQGIRNAVTEVSNQLALLTVSNDQPQSVFMTFTGFLNHDVLSYSLRKQGISSMQVHGWFFRPEEEDPRVVFGRGIDRADIVIAASEGAWVANSPMPSNRILPLTLSLVQQNPEFDLLKAIPSGKGAVYLYIRKVNEHHPNSR